jgi:glucose-6-phosphate 1-epimerase
LETGQSKVISQTGFAQLSDLPCIKLQIGPASAVVSLYGGQLLSYQSKPALEHIWLSESANWHNGAAIRGGVPICWPWFGPANSTITPSQQALPNHGLVRNRFWQCRNSLSNSEAISVIMAIEVTDIPVALWPNPAQVYKPVTLTLTVTLTASQLSMQLECDTSLYQQAALHSYFRINNVAQSRVTGLSAQYYDKVSDTRQLSNSNEARFIAETDRIYYNTANQLQLIDEKKQLNIQQQGHNASVIWNPWQQKSIALPDMADNGFTEFVCVETAMLDNSIGRTLSLKQTLSSF